MTAIIGLQTTQGIYLASDTLLIKDGSCKEIVPTKIFRKENFLFAIAGDWRGAELVQHIFKVPRKTQKSTFMSYLYNRFIPALGDVIPEDCNSEYIIAARDGARRFLLVLDEDLNFHIVSEDFICGGAASEICCGAMAVLRNMWLRDNSDKMIYCVLQKAIECAIQYMPTCGGTVVISKL